MEGQTSATAIPPALPLRLLKAGESEVHVYGDGSCYQELEVGAWAFFIPAFEVSRVGFGLGSHVEYFEFQAILAGMESIVSVDGTARPIRVHTDSQFVMNTLKHLGETGQLPSRPAFERIRRQFVRAGELLGTRSIVCSKCSRHSPWHLKCHTAALGNLREQIRSNGMIGHHLALKRQQQRLSTLVAERAERERQLQRLEKEILLCEVTLSALRRAGETISTRSIQAAFGKSDAP